MMTRNNFPPPLWGVIDPRRLLSSLPGGVPSRESLILEMLEDDLEAEVRAILAYQRHASAIEAMGHYDTANLLRHILQEEIHHRSELVAKIKEIEDLL